MYLATLCALGFHYMLCGQYFFASDSDSFPSSFYMQMKLRHRISSEILIYPGYAPSPGVNYRVFHYGLEFKVGNWSFDKAKWRNTDVVNRCWAQFPDPPDPSTLDQTDNNILQRDLLSIECIKTLNEALRLHHERRKCPDPNSLSNSNSDAQEELVVSRKFGKMNVSSVVESNHDQKNQSGELSEPTETDGMFSSVRFWVIAFWAFCGLGFLTVASVLFSGRKGKGKRGKSYRVKRRNSGSGFMDANGRDRHLQVPL